MQVLFFIRHLLVILVQEWVKPRFLLFISHLSCLDLVVDIAYDAEAEGNLDYEDTGDQNCVFAHLQVGLVLATIDNTWNWIFWGFFSQNSIVFMKCLLQFEGWGLELISEDWSFLQGKTAVLVWGCYQLLNRSFSGWCNTNGNGCQK